MSVSSESPSGTPQEEFDREYITGFEIQKSLGISRSTVLTARRRKLLPDPIIVNGSGCFIWKRKKVEPMIEAWRVMLASRRGQLG